MTRLLFTSRKLCHWPERDRALWLQAQCQGSPFDDAGRAAGWSPATISGCERGYGVWLTWLDGRGWLEPDQHPCSRVSRERVAAFLADYDPGRAALTTAGTLRDIAMVLRACEPPDGIGWLSKLGHRMVNMAKPARAKLPRMASIPALLDLADRLMVTGNARLGEGKISGAILYRDGLLIAFLAARPLRLRNLAELQLGETILVSEHGVRLDLPADATKKGVPFANTLPDRMIEQFRHYLAVVRPAFRKQRHDDPGWLWLGRGGQPLTPQGIRTRISKMCQVHLGKNTTPHLFRDCAATQIAITAPELIGITKDVLNHATPASSQKFYNQATSMAAVARHADLIRRLRGEEEV